MVVKNSECWFDSQDRTEQNKTGQKSRGREDLGEQRRLLRMSGMEASSQLAFNDDINLFSRSTPAGWLLKQGESIGVSRHLCVCVCACVGISLLLFFFFLFSQMLEVSIGIAHTPRVKKKMIAFLRECD